MSTPLYLALCLVAPILWGVFSAWLFDMVEARRRALRAGRSQSEDSPPTADMYEI